MGKETKAVTYKVYLRRVTANRVNYKEYLSQLLSTAFPFEIKYASDEHIRKFMIWAIRESYSVVGKKNIKMRKNQMRLENIIEELEGVKLKKLVCNLILAGEGMSNNALKRKK